MVWWLPMHCNWRLLGGLWNLGARLNVSFLLIVQLLRKSSQRLIQKSSSQWCGCSGNPPLNGATAPSHIPENNLAPPTRIPLSVVVDLLPVWCHPLFWCMLKASQEWCSWSFFVSKGVRLSYACWKRPKNGAASRSSSPKVSDSLMRAESVPSIVRLVLLLS